MAIPLETQIFVFNRTDPFFDSPNPELPPAGRLGAGHTAELLGRRRDSIAPLEDGSAIDALADPAIDHARARRADRAERECQELVRRIFDVTG